MAQVFLIPCGNALYREEVEGTASAKLARVMKDILLPDLTQLSPSPQSSAPAPQPSSSDACSLPQFPPVTPLTLPLNLSFYGWRFLGNMLPQAKEKESSKICRTVEMRGTTTFIQMTWI